MTDLVVALKLTADGSDLVSEVRLSSAELKQLGVAAGQAEVEARRTAAGLGSVEVQTRQAAAATRAFTNETRAMANAINEYDDKLDGMRAKFNPFVALQRDYVARQKEINAAVAQGGINQIEGQRELDRTRTAYSRNLNSLKAMTAASREHTGAVKLQGYQITNLGYQIQDVGVQLASGTNPFVILAQQGPQATSAVGGVKNALALVAPYFTATTVTVGFLTAGLVAGAAAWHSYLASVKAVETASQGRGRSLGISPGDLEAIASAGAEASGISQKTARDAEVSFLNTGRIGQATMRGLISISRDYANLIGSDVSTAIDDLAQKFKDPAKGAEELQKSYDLLDDRTKRYIETLTSQNRIYEAQAALFSALNKRVENSADQITALGRGWNYVSNGISNAWDGLGAFVDRMVDGVPASQAYLDELTNVQTAAEKVGARGVLLKGVGVLDMNELDDEITRVKSKLAKLRADAANDNLNRISARAGDIGRKYTPGVSELDQLRTDQASANAVLHNQDAAARVDNLGQVANAYLAVGHAIDTYLTPAQRAQRLDDLSLQALTARSPAEKGRIAEERKSVELAGQSISAGEVETQIIRAGTVARQTATQAIADQNTATAINTRATLDVAAAMLTSADAAERAKARRTALSEAFQNGANVETQSRLQLKAAIATQAETAAQSVLDLNQQASVQKRVNDAVSAGTLTVAQANDKAKVDAALRPLLTARALAEGDAKAQLTKIINALTAAYGRLNAEQARAAANDIIAGQKDELATLQAEAQAIGKSAEARAVSTAVLQAEQQARRQNIDLASTQGQTIVSNAAKNARATVEVERQQDAYNGLAQVGQSALDNLSDSIAKNGLSWTSLADVATSALQDIMQELTRLAISNPLKNALFGTNAGTLSDAGGLLGSLFGSGVFHTGGVVGEGANDNAVRAVPVSTFAHAQRRHMGGLAANEVPIIAKKGEEVLTADDPRHINNLGKGGKTGSGRGDVIVNNYPAPGTESKVTTRKGANGETIIDIVGREIKKSIASDIANGQGDITDAMVGRFGLNRASGLQS